jgi:hypothetical protein
MTEKSVVFKQNMILATNYDVFFFWFEAVSFLFWQEYDIKI